jgi:hypothetical protein
MPCSHVYARLVRDTRSESRLAEEPVDFALKTSRRREHYCATFSNLICTMYLEHLHHRVTLSLRLIALVGPFSRLPPPALLHTAGFPPASTPSSFTGKLPPRTLQGCRWHLAPSTSPQVHHCFSLGAPPFTLEPDSSTSMNPTWGGWGYTVTLPHDGRAIEFLFMIHLIVEIYHFFFLLVSIRCSWYRVFFLKKCRMHKLRLIGEICHFSSS